jgi:hypothetical protein
MHQKERSLQVHWDIAKLLEMGVSEALIKELSEDEIRDLLKACLYLRERFPALRENISQ